MPAKRNVFGQIVIYNRVPKTGSTTLTNAVAYDLFKANGFNVIHVNITKNKQILSLGDQYHFVNNVTTWTERLPAFYHGHLSFVDFTRFGFPNPIYINILREPLDRLLSHYYFLRYGDNYRIGLKRSRAGNNETFDECVDRNGHDCDVKQLWLQIPYFCGHHHFCSDVGSTEALEQAKRNLLEYYTVVGVTERLTDFIALLEHTLPHFFKGALTHYMDLDQNRAHLRSTKKKITPNDHTVSVIKRTTAYKLEKEFYDFAKNEFDALFKKATNGTGRLESLQTNVHQFHYEKIKPEKPRFI